MSSPAGVRSLCNPTPDARTSKCKSHFFSTSNKSVPTAITTGELHVAVAKLFRFAPHRMKSMPTAPSRDKLSDGARGASFGDRYLSGEPSAHLRTCVLRQGQG